MTQQDTTNKQSPAKRRQQINIERIVIGLILLWGLIVFGLLIYGTMVQNQHAANLLPTVAPTAKS